MAVIIGTQKQVDDYFESENVNQSTLKSLDGGLDNYLAEIAKKEKEKEENKPIPEHFLIGGAVDTILTGVEGEFEKQYYVSNLEKKPSDAEMAIVRQVFDELVENNIKIDMPLTGYTEMLAIAIVDQNWYGGKPGEKRTAGLIDRCGEYFEDLTNSVGKKILTATMKNTIDAIVMSLTTNPRTSKYFNREMQSEQTNMDFYYQLPIYFTYEGVDCKALLDLVIVYKDDSGNIISIEPIDLKTMSGNTLQFIGKIKAHRYDIQAAWYNRAIIEYFKVSQEQIEPFKFIVESSTNQGKPLVFRISNNTLIHGRIGEREGIFSASEGPRQILYNEIKGYEQLMQDYIYYENQGWVQDKVLDKYPGVVEIDWTRGIL